MARNRKWAVDFTICFEPDPNNPEQKNGFKADLTIFVDATDEKSAREKAYNCFNLNAKTDFYISDTNIFCKLDE